jgi:hypothetical protein
MPLSEEETSSCIATKEHIKNVQKYISIMIDELITRSIDHDKSKMEQPELECFAKYTPILSGLTYGSEEYKKHLIEMKPALDHHYANNLHHPEHSEDGIDDMNLIDITEMFCDWLAATRRHHDGDINKSIEINSKRFNMSPQLVSIFNNTVKLFKEKYA